MTDRFASWTTYAPTPINGPSLPSVVPSHLRGRRRADPEPGSLFGRGRTVPRRTRGWSGTRIHGGRVSGHEENPELQGARWFAEARRMRRTDDAIAAGWYATLASLLTARWSWAPGDPDDGLSRKIADEQTEMWSRLRRPWSRALRQALLYLCDGARYGETAWGIGPTGRIDVLDAWLDREMVAHDTWAIEGDTWHGVYQRHPMGDAARFTQGPGPFIPADELTYLGHGVEGQNLDGLGLLRPLWNRWKQRVDVLDMSMSAAERWSNPVPVVDVDTLAARELGMTPAEIEQQVADVEAGIEAFITGDAAHLRKTSIVGLSTYGGDVKLGEAVPMLDHLDGALLRGFLLQLLTLGTTSTGSRSVGEVHRNIWRDSLLVPLDDVSEAFSGPARPGGGVGARWTELNYGRVHPDRLARLEHSGLSVDPLVDLVERLDAQKLSLFDIGQNRSDKDAMRRRLGLDPLPVPDEIEPVEEEDGDQIDLPVRPGLYTMSNRDVAELTGSSTGRVSSLVRRSLAAGLEVPAIGAGRDRRWDATPGVVLAWYQQLTGGGAT